MSARRGATPPSRLHPRPRAHEQPCLSQYRVLITTLMMAGDVSPYGAGLRGGHPGDVVWARAADAALPRSTSRLGHRRPTGRSHGGDVRLLILPPRRRQPGAAPPRSSFPRPCPFEVCARLHPIGRPHGLDIESPVTAAPVGRRAREVDYRAVALSFLRSAGGPILSTARHRLTHEPSRGDLIVPQTRCVQTTERLPLCLCRYEADAEASSARARRAMTRLQSSRRL